MADASTKSTQSSVLVIWAGSFGRAVSRHLFELYPGVLEREANSDSLNYPDARAYAVVSWRPLPHLCEALDRLCRQKDRIFLPLIADGGYIRLGPVTAKGSGACWKCWARRFLQHDRHSEERESVWKHYSIVPESGPQGFLEPLALLSAARISAAIDAAERGALTWQIWQIDILTRAMAMYSVVGVHGCPVCGLGRSEQTRSFQEMKNHIAGLWTQTTNDEISEHR